jgi:3-methyladenine DNA glycosylase AlkD
VKAASAPSASGGVEGILARLRRLGRRRNREGMARYGIVSKHVLGVSVANLRDMAKRIGRSHELAAGLWDTGVYEARMLAAFVDEPERVTGGQMDRWCRDFDNWAICDHCCFHLFDRTVHAWAKVRAWSRRTPEFERRAAFALLASLALHDKAAPDRPFRDALPLIERAAADDRNFVKKGVSWALRGVGRRSPLLHASALAVARRLAASRESAPRWIGKDALRELTSGPVLARLEARGKA